MEVTRHELREVGDVDGINCLEDGAIDVLLKGEEEGNDEQDDSGSEGREEMFNKTPRKCVLRTEPETREPTLGNTDPSSSPPLSVIRLFSLVGTEREEEERRETCTHEAEKGEEAAIEKE